MATVTATTKLRAGQGSDANTLISQRVRTIGDTIYNITDRVPDNGSTVTLWQTGDGGLSLIDFGVFQVDPNGLRSDGAATSVLYLEIASASFTHIMEVNLEVAQTVPGKLSGSLGGAFEDVTQIRAHNPNASGIGQIVCKLSAFGRAS